METVGIAVHLSFCPNLYYNRLNFLRNGGNLHDVTKLLTTRIQWGNIPPFHSIKLR